MRYIFLISLLLSLTGCRDDSKLGGVWYKRLCGRNFCMNEGIHSYDTEKECTEACMSENGNGEDDETPNVMCECMQDVRGIGI